jgi:AcrR family transcriptional regulator
MAFSPPGKAGLENSGLENSGWQDRAIDRTMADTRARDVERMERCSAAARELANETSSASFTVAQIAARAEVSLKSFYRCFPGKDELLLALLEDDSHIGARVLAQRVGTRDDPLAALHACVTELFAFLSVPGALGYAGVLVREHRRLSEHYPLELRVALAPLVELIAVHIDAATSTSDALRDAETMFRILLQGIDDVIVGRSRNAGELGEYLWQFCWQGLAGPLDGPGPSGASGMEG